MEVCDLLSHVTLLIRSTFVLHLNIEGMLVSGGFHFNIKWQYCDT